MISWIGLKATFRFCVERIKRTPGASMSSHDIAHQLREQCAIQKFTWMERSDGEEMGFGGIPLHLGQKYVLLGFLDDFQVNGYKILPVSTITRVRYEETELFYQRILDHEGISVASLDVPSGILDSSAACCRWLYELETVLTIEHGEADFSVGRIVSLDRDHISIAAITPTGQLHKVVDQIAMQEITLIGFGDRYTRLLAKYSQPRTQH